MKNLIGKKKNWQEEVLVVVKMRRKMMMKRKTAVSAAQYLNIYGCSFFAAPAVAFTTYSMLGEWT